MFANRIQRNASYRSTFSRSCIRSGETLEGSLTMFFLMRLEQIESECLLFCSRLPTRFKPRLMSDVIEGDCVKKDCITARRASPYDSHHSHSKSIELRSIIPFPVRLSTRGIEKSTLGHVVRRLRYRLHLRESCCCCFFQPAERSTMIRYTEKCDMCTKLNCALVIDFLHRRSQRTVDGVRRVASHMLCSTAVDSHDEIPVAARRTTSA